MDRRIRLGMVGGGQGAFIGAVHRIAARLDDQYELVAVALSSDPTRARESALPLRVSPDRVYLDFEEMARAEGLRPDGIEVVAIVVPNHLHSRAAAAFLASGIHVICDKPLATTLADARELQQLQKASRRLFMLTYNYTGYPMIREARARIAAGQLGRLRLVQVEYAQDWLSPDVERRGSKQAKWRTDPGLAGAGGALGDIGTHAWNLAAYVCGETPTSVLCESTAFGSGRILDDNAFVLMRYQSGARGALWVSQVAVGNDNRLRLRIYGERGGLEWCHEAPDVLVASEIGVPSKLLTRNGNGVGPEATRVARVPAGHPEGFLEGFATLYSEFALAIRAADNRLPPDPNVQYPTVEDGVSGLEFIGACVLSSTKGGLWVNLADLPS